MKDIAGLSDLALQCISYVGQANYPERERHAKLSLIRGFGEFRKGVKVAPLGPDLSDDDKDDKDCGD